jgi:S1-C subfamily serine protease
VNLLDVVILATAVLAGVGGYRLGFIARVASWAGMTLGVVVAARALPDVVEGLGDGTDPRGRLALATVVLLAGAFLGQALGLVVGHRAHVAVPVDARAVDRAGGAAAGVIGVLVLFWVLLPGLGEIPGRISLETRGSAIARFVATSAPAPPDTLQALRHLVGESNFPRVFDAFGEAPDSGPPPGASGVAPDVLERLVASTVRVEGTACGRVLEGSGFVVGRNVIVTNAHVVAGQRTTSVISRNGRRARATVVQFDPDRDLALLVASVDAAPLPVGDADVGDEGAVLGYPGGGPLEVSPFAVRDRIVAVGRDLYDRDQISRRVLVLASDLRPGDSGAAIVDHAGTVIGVAFAIAPDRASTAYALDTSELRAVLDSDRSGRVTTGSCVP